MPVQEVQELSHAPTVLVDPLATLVEDAWYVPLAQGVHVMSTVVEATAA